MQAIDGYFENGRFIPNERVTLPKRVQAVLVFSENKIDNDKTERLFWLEKFHDAVKQAENEEMAYIPRSTGMRPPINLSDEE